MNQDEHQRERMRLWSTSYTGNFVDGHPPGRCCDFADAAVAEFDKRFPAPVEQAPAEQADDAGFNYKDVASADVTVAELATLRDKARLWDAVASGKVTLRRVVDGSLCANLYGAIPPNGFHYRPTAAEAVEAAIAAGALK